MICSSRFIRIIQHILLLVYVAAFVTIIAMSWYAHFNIISVVTHLYSLIVENNRRFAADSFPIKSTMAVYIIDELNLKSKSIVYVKTAFDVGTRLYSCMLFHCLSSSSSGFLQCAISWQQIACKRNTCYGKTILRKRTNKYYQTWVNIAVKHALSVYCVIYIYIYIYIYLVIDNAWEQNVMALNLEKLGWALIQ